MTPATSEAQSQLCLSPPHPPPLLGISITAIHTSDLWSH